MGTIKMGRILQMMIAWVMQMLFSGNAKKNNCRRHTWGMVCAEAEKPDRRFSMPVVECAIEAGDATIGKQPSVSMIAYNGGLLPGIKGYPYPVVVAIDGLTGLGQSVSMLRDHDRSRIVGFIQATAENHKILASGKLAGKSADREEVESLSADGYQWQASIGVNPSEVKFVKVGQKVQANGQTFDGPLYLIKSGRLTEISLLPVGSDADTYVTVAAGDDDSDGDEGGNLPPVNGALDRLIAERTRRERIETLAVEAGNSAPNTGDINRIQELMTSAIQAGDSPQAFELALLRNIQRPQTRISSGGGNELQGRELEQAVEASLMLTLGASASDLEAQFPDRVLAAMDRNVDLKNGLSLQDVLLFAAERNNQRVSRRNVEAMLRGAFPHVEANGLSTFSLSGILGNVANKQLKAAFESVESAWRAISEIRPVSDFKQITSYSLTGDMTFEKVAPGGELKHGKLGEASFTNQADTYGKMFSLDRRDIINDDLSALSATPRRLGRGGALKLNDVFWAIWNGNSGSFFHADNKNLIGSGSASPWYLLGDPMDLAAIQVVFLNGKQMPTVEQTDADFKQLGIQMRGYWDFGVAYQEPRAAVKSPATLDLDATAAAYKLFLDQTDRDGKPLALAPKIMLVSTSNFVTANTIKTATQIQSGNTGKVLNNNPFAGMFDVVMSAYLTNV